MPVEHDAVPLHQGKAKPRTLQHIPACTFRFAINLLEYPLHPPVPAIIHERGGRSQATPAT